MESTKNNFLFVLVFLCAFLGNAQEIKSDASTATNTFLNKELATLKNVELNDSKSTKNNVLNRNIVQISQLGQYNDADIRIKSSNSNLEVFQDGSNNSLQLQKSAKQINQTIVQSGNNNFISDISSYYGKSIDMSINQEGNNLKLVNSGTNSISKDLKISQQGNSGNIFIFNY